MNQPRAIADLRLHFPHSIELRRLADRKHGFNCFALCFGIERSEKMQFLAGCRNIIPNSTYAKHLTDNVLEEIDQDHQEDGDYVMYSHDGHPTHAGLLSTLGVVSKWGSRGHVWKHGLWEVPSSYGDAARFFRRMPAHICESTYLDWANKKRDK